MESIGASSENWPTTVEDVVKDIIASMSQRDRDAIRKTERWDLSGLHFGLGMYIRNHYGLLSGNEALIDAVCGDDYLRDPDDVSMAIIEAVWESLRNG